MVLVNETGVALPADLIKDGQQHKAAGLAPFQDRALQQLLAAVRARAPMIELRSPAGRGHGISTVFRALAAGLGEKSVMLGVKETLGSEHPEKALFAAAAKNLEAGAVVIVDDADIAVRPQKVRASRNAGDHFRGAGNWAFEDPPEPLRLLKALQEEAQSHGGVVVFSTVEEGHARYMQEPYVVRLESARKEDVAAVLESTLQGIDPTALFKGLPTVPSLAQIRSAVVRATAAGGTLDLEKLTSAVRENLTCDAAVSVEEVEKISLPECPGMKKIAQTLETHVLYPILNPQESRRQGLLPKRGVLLHGPPGTGKTTIGRALAHRLQGRFFMIRELLLYKDMFEVFAQARAVAPSVVFFDDIDILLGGWNGMVEGARGHDLTRFLLSQMDGLCTTLESQVVVVMAAADAKCLPPAIVRSGRIELWLKLEKPKRRDRSAIIQKYVEQAQSSVAEDAPELLRAPLDLEEVSTACEDFVPADLRRLVSDARNVSAADGAKKPGGEYLKEAASQLKDMKVEVDGLSGRMFT
jgi:ATP-dependent 26S proteasome regulatory subunit